MSLKMSIKNQFILMIALLSVVLVAIVANLIGGSLSFAIGYGVLAVTTWSLSRHFKKETIITTSLSYLFLILSSAHLTVYLLS